MASEVLMNYRRIMAIEANKRDINGRIFYGRYDMELLEPTEVQYVDIRRVIKVDILQFNDEEIYVREASTNKNKYIPWSSVLGIVKVPDA